MRITIITGRRSNQTKSSIESVHRIECVALVLIEHPLDEQLEHFGRQAHSINFAQPASQGFA